VVRKSDAWIEEALEGGKGLVLLSQDSLMFIYYSASPLILQTFVPDVLNFQVSLFDINQCQWSVV